MRTREGAFVRLVLGTLLGAVGCSAIKIGCQVIDVTDQACDIVTVRYLDENGKVQTELVRRKVIENVAVLARVKRLGHVAH